MIPNTYKIFVDQLKNGHVEKIDEKFSPAFLDIHEKELKFDKDVLVKGEAYTADGDLILHLDIEACATLPCSICNEPVFVEINIKNLYHYVPLEEIKGALFPLDDVLREAILLETPSFAECTNGCPKRKEIEKYMRKPKSSTDEQEDGFRPFENL